MFFNKLFKPRKIRIIRVANEGFNIKSFGDASIFLDANVTNLEQNSMISLQHANRYLSNPMEGCFCFLEGFDTTQLLSSGELFYRGNDAWFEGYLPKDEIVFVRNTKNNNLADPNDRYIKGHYINQNDPLTGKPVVRLYTG